jgi:ElaB/YqjD/DUF883 family membrane-anchored ribosome-binding protein
MTQEYSEKSNEAIEADIHETRQRMDLTLDRLIDRLQPRHLLNDLLDFWQSRRSRQRQGDGKHIAESIRENTRKASQTLVHQVRDNPVPSLLIGAGIAWLIFDRSRSDDQRVWSQPPQDLYGDEDYDVAMGYETSSEAARESESADQNVAGQMAEARDKAGDVAGQARRKLRQTGQHLRERARHRSQRIRARTSHATHEMQDRVRDTYERAQERVREGYARTQAQLKQAAEMHPLATGAACLGIGLLAGFLLPKSERENRWFGDVSETVRHRVKETGQDLVDRGKHVAEAATEAVRSEAQHQGLTPDKLKESVKAVGHEAMESAEHAAEEEGLLSDSSKQKSPAATGIAESSSGDKPGNPSI